MGLLDKIKQAAESTSESREDFFYTKPGEENMKRIRLLTEIDDGIEVVVHKSAINKQFGVPCQKQFGRKCPMCDMVENKIDDWATREYYCFPIYNKTEKKQQMLYGTAWKSFTAITPIIHDFALTEDQKSFTDRDYVVLQTGEKDKKNITVKSMQPCPLKLNIKPWTKAEMMEKIDKAYPYKINLDVEPEDDNMPF